MSRLAGKVALVTGGSAGLGAAICTRFANAGADVWVADLDPPVDAGQYIKTDVSDRDQLEAAFLKALKIAGRIDLLVSNAAIQPHGITLDDTTPELLDRVFKVNTHAVFYGLQLAGCYMARGGSVINTSSFVGKIGVPNCPSYAASKAAVDHLTRVGAIELASKGIRVNAVAPGLVMTPAVTGIPDNPEIGFMHARIPMGRIPSPDEIAPVFEFLASDEASFVTGAVIPVDGGVAAGWKEYELKPPTWWK
ncbi:MAG: SDR family oxidoreductase [Verrucomicrobiae bacterium]|nr:SDR family oxidoreductase [Verrucomicrobiae bacterium]